MEGKRRGGGVYLREERGGRLFSRWQQSSDDVVVSGWNGRGGEKIVDTRTNHKEESWVCETTLRHNWN